MRLTDICHPKQWKTIPTSQLQESGFPVYGANGLIGYYKEYNHESPTLLITCRGATCGKINISLPKSYITGNAMCLDDLSSDYDMRYLAHYLRQYDFKKIISGSAQPQITRRNLSKVEIPELSLEAQIECRSHLDAILLLINKEKERIAKLDNLVKSRFVEMFGATTNELLSSWKTAELVKCVTSIDTGSSPKCKMEPRTGLAPGVLKLSALSSGSYISSENKAMVDGSEIHRNKEVQQGDLLIARKNTPELVGACVLVKETASNLMFPDLVFRMHPNDGIEGSYLVTLLSNSPYASEVRGLAHGTARSMSNIPKSALAKLSIPVPPLTLQQEFAAFVAQVDKSQFAVRQSIEQLELLKAKLEQEHFS